EPAWRSALEWRVKDVERACRITLYIFSVGSPPGRGPVSATLLCCWPERPGHDAVGADPARHDPLERSTVLSLGFLGDMEVCRDGARLALPQSKKTRALLAYLAVTGRPHRRDRLCALLWEMPDDPRGALRWSLSKLRPLVDEPAQRRI